MRNPPPPPSERVRRLWEAADPPAGRRGLSPARVVEAAIAVADADGLTALSMARVADHLGVSTMASYRHVKSKDALIELMVDVAAGTPPEIDLAVGWRAAAETWALAMAEPFVHHPWLAEVPVSRIPAGPHQVQWIEAGLRALRPSGLDIGTRMQLVGLLASHVRSALVLERDLASGGQDPAEAEQVFATDLAAVLDPGAFPELTALLAVWDVHVAPPAVGTFAEIVIGLSVLLDGIEVLVERAVTPPSG